MTTVLSHGLKLTHNSQQGSWEIKIDMILMGKRGWGLLFSALTPNSGDHMYC